MAAKLMDSARLKFKSDLSKSLASLLECPVCFNFMAPPITQCLNGHNICSSCRPRLALCPTCRQSLTITSRNVALENIAETIVDSHSNKQLSVSLPQHRLYECLTGKSMGCTWKGRQSDLWSHVLLKHHRSAMHWKREIRLFRVSNHDFSVNGTSTLLISVFDQLFWYQLRQDSSKNRWCQAIQYIGSKKQAVTYKYTLEFGPVPDDSLKRTIVYSRATHPEEEHIDNIFKSSDCFCTDLNSIKYFVARNNSLQFKVKIERM
ncbi:E3 ubiquitin-protein ligase Siah1 [Cryptotermes secundus]|uniref:E3 ubiquitin-protein ligase Siah1 n=1 Tax=Cryptotermes secundus TaxID=105785 RepID=UPI000CD7D593|nr:E3 ubiquitin-protein ligase Siah1 [Cryptotermes secundus]XP_023711831.1 E3 ubiquitin-protein ligase Siah1 [Cryptotermes secundus]XP_033608316.1 E3 ubiquitin-protein ligase Siah1 [Cryptotermes secundus]